MKPGQLPLHAGVVLLVVGCNRTQPSEPAPPAVAEAVDAGIPHLTLAQAAGLSGTEKAPEIPATDADFVKLGKRDIDWGLDQADPASDYVERYIQATRRYGTERPCVHAQPSRIANGRALVEARDSQEAGCNGTGAVRDTFAVDVAHDHLELADRAVGSPLGDWPDGSSPDGMPAPSPKEGPAIESWQSPLPKALRALKLVPLRVQFYGRGSYPLISIAGWHGSLTLTSTPAELESDAKTICQASAGFPVGIVATMDRSTVLRIRCPNTASWEHL
jgi:hypothetical protein